MMHARILVVDDNPNNLDLILYLLRAFGHSPVGFTTAHAALEQARTFYYDLILADIRMPDMDGFEFARRVRSDARLKDARLVAVTAMAMAGDRERILQAGFDGYLSKPIDPERFVHQIEGFLAPPKTAPPVQQEPVNVPGGPLVLLVDDIRLNREVIRVALRPAGFRVVEASSFREAIERIAEAKPQLILCDVHMPDLNGLDLIAYVKGDPDLKDIPFIFISSTAWQTTDRVRGLELGAHGFILRPIEPGRLLEEVRAAIATADVKNSHR